MQRGRDVVTTLLSVLSSALVGFVLILAPWTRLWEANYLLQASPWLRDFLLHHATRGAITGLGLVNILLAFHDLLGLWRHVYGRH